MTVKRWKLSLAFFVFLCIFLSTLCSHICDLRSSLKKTTSHTHTKQMTIITHTCSILEKKWDDSIS
jgi:hypothetical protein